MKNSLTRCCVLVGAVLLAGCATSQSMGVQRGASVTRFHLGQPIARGQIAVESTDPQFAAPIERELARLGWSVVSGNARSEQVAVVRVDQGSRERMRSRPAVSIGIGGGSFGRGGGVGVGVGGSIPIGERRSGEVVVTELGVRIQRRSDATVAWEGRAQLEAAAHTPLSDARAAADRLAIALFQDFPGESGRTIRIR